jgi:hypothetical protein
MNPEPTNPNPDPHPDSQVGATNTSPEPTNPKKLRSDSRWWQFTESEQADIRRIHEREGQRAASAYCSRINKPWSVSALCDFFCKNRAGRFPRGLRDVSKLRSDSRWHQFTETERVDIQEVYLRDGIEPASAYCSKIDKPWSKQALAKFFSREREAKLAQDTKTSERAAETVAVRESYAKDGLQVSEAAAHEAARKIRQIVEMKAADPETAEGREIIREAVRSLIGLRGLAMREDIEAKRLEARYEGLKLRWTIFRYNAVDEVLKHPNEVRQITAGGGSRQDKTQALGRLIFGKEWDT